MTENTQDIEVSPLSSRRSSSINKKMLFTKQIKDITKDQVSLRRPGIYDALKKPDQTLVNSFETFEIYTTINEQDHKPAKVQKSANIEKLKLKISKEKIQSVPSNVPKSDEHIPISPPDPFYTERHLPKSHVLEGNNPIENKNYLNLILSRKNSMPVRAEAKTGMIGNHKEDIKNLLEFCRQKDSKKSNDPGLGIFGTFSLKNMKEYLGQRPP